MLIQMWDVHVAPVSRGSWHRRMQAQRIELGGRRFQMWAYPCIMHAHIELFIGNLLDADPSRW
jgi:hypothetical protein